MYVALNGQLVAFFLIEFPDRLQQKVVEVMTLLLRSMNGIIALKPFLAERAFILRISSSLVILENLKSSKSGVSTKESLSIGIAPDVDYLIE
jgi:hypothetical protein